MRKKMIAINFTLVLLLGLLTCICISMGKITEQVSEEQNNEFGPGASEEKENESPMYISSADTTQEMAASETDAPIPYETTMEGADTELLQTQPSMTISPATNPTAAEHIETTAPEIEPTEIETGGKNSGNSLPEDEF